MRLTQELLSDRELLRRVEIALQDFENAARAPFEYRSCAQGRAALDELKERSENREPFAKHAIL